MFKQYHIVLSIFLILNISSLQAEKVLCSWHKMISIVVKNVPNFKQSSQWIKLQSMMRKHTDEDGNITSEENLDLIYNSLTRWKKQNYRDCIVYKIASELIKYLNDVKNGKGEKSIIFATRQDIVSFVREEIPYMRKSKSYDDFLEILITHCKSGEITSLKALGRLRKSLLNWRHKCNYKTIIYKILSVTSDYLNQLEEVYAYKWRKNKDTKKLEKECNICFDELTKDTEGINLGCCEAATFCLDCIGCWYAERKKDNDNHTQCPYCRTDIFYRLKQKIKDSESHVAARRKFWQENPGERLRQIQRDERLARELDRQWNGNRQLRN